MKWSKVLKKGGILWNEHLDLRLFQSFMVRGMEKYLFGSKERIHSDCISLIILCFPSDLGELSSVFIRSKFPIETDVSMEDGRILIRADNVFT
jgi:hypothetical protein